MIPFRRLPIALFAALLLACGDGGGSTNLVSFGVSDAPVGDLTSVTITIERITANQPGGDIVIERFPDDSGDETITVDLLDYQGTSNKIVVEDFELPVGDYQNLRLEIDDSDIGATYAEEPGGAHKPIKVPSGELKLGGFSVGSGDPQVFVIEFNILHSMNYKPGPDEYTLKPRGVRIVDVETAGHVEGTVDTSLFDAAPECDGKPDVNDGNLVYLYEGHGLDPADLGDLFDPDVDPGAAMDYIAPYSAHAVASDGTYSSSYLPAGLYTLAFSCDATGEDPEVHQGFRIPFPANKSVEIDLAEGETLACDVPASGSPCS